MDQIKYAGLRIEDFDILASAKRNGFHVQWLDSVDGVVHINEALAQIAEMESAENTGGCAYCTSEELQGYALEIVHGKYPKIIGLSNKGVMSKGQSAFTYCPNCGRSINSPYTEGGHR